MALVIGAVAGGVLGVLLIQLPIFDDFQSDISAADDLLAFWLGGLVGALSGLVIGVTQLSKTREDD
jgi:hypothetical protein